MASPPAAPGPPERGPGNVGRARTQSLTIPPYVMDTRSLPRGSDGKPHDQPDIVIIERLQPKSGPMGPVGRRITLIDVTTCLERGVKEAVARKIERYTPLRRALQRLNYIVPEVVVIPLCVRGSIPASASGALATVGINRGPAERLLRRAHIIMCDYMRRLLHTRRATEAVTLGPQGIATRFIRKLKAANRG